MVGARAHVGEAECDVHGTIELNRFQGAEALVVIHGNDAIEVTFQVAPKNCVSGQAFRKAREFGPQVVEPWIEPADFIIT